MERRPRLVDYEIDDSSDSDNPHHNFMVRPDINETIRDVNLNGVIVALMDKITAIFVSLSDYPMTRQLSSTRHRCFLRNVQLMQELLRTLQFIVMTKQSLVEYKAPRETLC